MRLIASFFALLLLLPQLSWAGGVYTSIDGDMSELVARTVGNFRPVGHTTWWTVDTSNLEDGLLFELVTVNTGELGATGGPVGGGGGFITITELPLGDETLIFDSDVVLRHSYLQTSDEDGVVWEIKNDLEVVSGVDLDLEASFINLEFLPRNQFQTIIHLNGLITEGYSVVPEPTTIVLVALGAGCLIRRRR